MRCFQSPEFGWCRSRARYASRACVRACVCAYIFALAGTKVLLSNVIIDNNGIICSWSGSKGSSASSAPSHKGCCTMCPSVWICRWIKRMKLAYTELLGIGEKMMPLFEELWEIICVCAIFARNFPSFRSVWCVNRSVTWQRHSEYPRKKHIEAFAEITYKQWHPVEAAAAT